MSSKPEPRSVLLLRLCIYLNMYKFFLKARVSLRTKFRYTAQDS